MFQFTRRVKEIPYSFKIRAGFSTALNYKEFYKVNTLNICSPAMLELPSQKVSSFYSSCSCCLCNQCDCCLFPDARGRKCDDELCQCRYRQSVFCTTIGKRVKYPRNKPFPDSIFLLERMEVDRGRERRRKKL